MQHLVAWPSCLKVTNEHRTLIEVKVKCIGKRLVLIIAPCQVCCRLVGCQFALKHAYTHAALHCTHTLLIVFFDGQNITLLKLCAPLQLDRNALHVCSQCNIPLRLLPCPTSASSCLHVHHTSPVQQKPSASYFFPIPSELHSPPRSLSFLLTPSSSSPSPVPSPTSSPPLIVRRESEADLQWMLSRPLVSLPLFLTLSLFYAHAHYLYLAHPKRYLKSPLVIQSSHARQGNAAKQSHTSTRTAYACTAACGSCMWNVWKP